MGRGVQHGVLVIAHQAQRTGVDQTGQAFAALGAGDVAVTVGHDHGVHDLLFGHLHHLEGLFAALFDELFGQALHTGKETGLPIMAAWATLGVTVTGCHTRASLGAA